MQRLHWLLVALMTVALVFSSALFDSASARKGRGHGLSRAVGYGLTSLAVGAGVAVKSVRRAARRAKRHLHGHARAIRRLGSKRSKRHGRRHSKTAKRASRGASTSRASRSARATGPSSTARLTPTSARANATLREETMLLQKRLNKLGFGAGLVDGIMGYRTRRAIAAFQASIGHIPTGEPTAEEMALLFSPQSPQADGKIATEQRNNSKGNGARAPEQPRARQTKTGPARRHEAVEGKAVASLGGEGTNAPAADSAAVGSRAKAGVAASTPDGASADGLGADGPSADRQSEPVPLVPDARWDVAAELPGVRYLKRLADKPETWEFACLDRARVWRYRRCGDAWCPIGARTGNGRERLDDMGIEEVAEIRCD